MFKIFIHSNPGLYRGISLAFQPGHPETVFKSLIFHLCPKAKVNSVMKVRDKKTILHS